MFIYQKALIRTFHSNFDNKITLVNSQHKNTNSKGSFVLKLGFKRSYKRFLNKQLRLKFSTHTTGIFNII